MTSKIKINQFKWLAATLLLVAAMVMPSTAWAQWIVDDEKPDGEGTPSSPYQISNQEDLYWFADLVNGTLSGVKQNTAACAVLTANIEVFSTWTPIMGYSGTFDGKGHTISGLQNTTNSDYIGLFGTTAEGSVIRNVGIVNCSFSVTGGGFVGGVCGQNKGTIKNCYTTGSINAVGEGCYGGGVCGLNNGTIKNCYNTGTVDGNLGEVGGVCGLNEGTIENCYNTGSVSEGRINGGVCGGNLENGTITNCYYLSDTATGGIYENFADVPISAESKTEVQFNRGEVAWLLNGKKSEGTEENPLAWYQYLNGDSYPVLDSSHGKVYYGYTICETKTYSNNQLSKNPVHNYDNGICEACKAYQPATLTTDQYDINGDDTKDEVYEIGNAGQLYWFAGLVNGDASVCDYDADSNPSGTKQNKAACAVLTANIVVNSGLEEGTTMLESLEYDASGKVTNGSNFVAWTPIGFDYEDYTGTFDGKGHTVSGLYFNDTSKERVGLFGCVDSGGKISNVGVLDSYFEFRMMGGGICGINYGEINNCYSFSTVINTNGYGGGVCGYNSGGKILNSYNNGIVSGNGNTGGVCGVFYSGSIENCLNKGAVSGTYNFTGGVCGYAEGGAIKRSYNTASVSGVIGVGGVCGYNEGATLEDCYNTGNFGGNQKVGGVCGENSSTIKNCYNSGTVSGTGSPDKIAGVCGLNNGSLANCYNTGNVSGQTSGGVCFENYGTIKNCYNTGKVSGQICCGGVCGDNYAPGTVMSCYNRGIVSGIDHVGGVCGSILGNSSITKCYFDSNIYSGKAIGNNSGGTVDEDDMGKTTAQFASGEICYLLNGSSPYGEWGQQFGTNGYPVLGSPYKVLRAARDGENGTNYWATFSNLDSNAELTAPTGTVTVYNATVSGGKLTLAKRSDNRVAKSEGVLLKAGCEYLNAMNISETVSAATAEENHLVATPATAQTITADDNYTLYRLTYNDVSDYAGLGFYLSLIKDENDEVDQSSVGKQLAATPGKAYLNVLTSEAKLQSSAAPARGFVFPGNDGETTGIECITVTDESLHSNGNADGIFDLQGRKVSKPTKGVYINNGKKVIIK